MQGTMSISHGQIMSARILIISIIIIISITIEFYIIIIIIIIIIRHELGLARPVWARLLVS
jgi:hypothetical protein